MATYTAGSPTGNGAWDTVPFPSSPDGDDFELFRSPRGLSTIHFHPLIDEIPVGDRGPVAIDDGYQVVASPTLFRRPQEG